jgi:GT2 family glycosyltransferase
VIVSVVIPTHDRARELRRTLAALAAQDAGGYELDVIVVDDGSAPPVEIADCPLPCRLVRQGHSGPAGARKRGAREARGEHLVFLDDDCVPRAGWLRSLVNAAKPGVAAAGALVNGEPQSACSEASGILLRAFIDAEAGRFQPTANLALRTEDFWRVGGFDDRFPLPGAEDRDFCARWIAAGFALRCEPAAVVDHVHAMGLLEFARQQARYGRGAHMFHRTPLGRPTDASFVGRLWRAGMSLETGPLRRAQVMTLLALSQAFMLAGYVAAAASTASSLRVTRANKRLVER